MSQSKGQHVLVLLGPMEQTLLWEISWLPEHETWVCSDRLAFWERSRSVSLELDVSPRGSAPAWWRDGWVGWAETQWTLLSTFFFPSCPWLPRPPPSTLSGRSQPTRTTAALGRGKQLLVTRLPIVLSLIQGIHQSSLSGNMEKAEAGLKLPLKNGFWYLLCARHSIRWWGSFGWWHLPPLQGAPALVEKWLDSTLPGNRDSEVKRVPGEEVITSHRIGERGGLCPWKEREDCCRAGGGTARQKALY